MKWVVKTIANRLKYLLTYVMEKEQNDFIKGRLITNNSLIAIECFHWLKKKKKG